MLEPRNATVTLCNIPSTGGRGAKDYLRVEASERQTGNENALMSRGTFVALVEMQSLDDDISSCR